MSGSGGDRGQINFDFAVGVSIVIVAVILAFSLVPSVFGGVTEGGQQADEVVADRIAANLVDGSLAVPNDPGAADTGCLRALFDDGLHYCGFDGGSVPENLEVEDRNVNVTVLGDTDPADDGLEQLYWDDAGGTITEDASVGDDKLAGGGALTNANQVGTATRAVTVDGQPVRIIVRVW